MLYFLVKRELDRLLKCKDVVDLSSNKDRFFIEVSNPDHRRMLLEGGPIFIAGRILLLREWSSELEAKDDPLLSIPLWINLEMPREIWSSEGIGFYASLFGLPLGMDEFTVKMSKTKFARVCIEVKNGFEFPESIQVDLFMRIDVIKFVYKWKPESSNQYRRFGHNSGNCSFVQGGSISSTDKRWQPVQARRQDKERVQVEMNGESSRSNATKESKMGHRQSGLVLVTRTRPGAINTIILRAEDRAGNISIANRFDSLMLDNETVAGDDRELDEMPRSNEKITTPKGSIGETEAHKHSGEDDTCVVQVAEQPLREVSGAPSTVKTLNDCLKICENIVESTRQDTICFKQNGKGPRVLEDPLVDKGGTKILNTKVDFDPQNPETWPESIKEANRKISIVLERMKNPVATITKPKKVDLKVKLVRGYRGASIGSSTKNKC